MSLETGTYINDLVPTNPAGTDPKSQGDDHLRLIKGVLKNTFPQADGPIKIDKDVSILGDGTIVNIGSASEDALQIDSAAKTIKALTPYTFDRTYQSGDVIQERNTVDNGSNTFSNSWINTTTVAQSITPKSINSTIIIDLVFLGLVSNAAGINTEAQYYIKEGAAFRGSQMNLGAPSGAGNSGIVGSVAMRAILPNASLASRAFLLFANCPQSVLIGATLQYWKITEVQN